MKLAETQDADFILIKGNPNLKFMSSPKRYIVICLLQKSDLAFVWISEKQLLKLIISSNIQALEQLQNLLQRDTFGPTARKIDNSGAYIACLQSTGTHVLL
ncbi:hypothetical protein NPIL_702231 [Nephila pilipes]|uniref:Uncharacterized protein n=1 Tax=Nephila pilipes TaxID=299642 RepID=A0A8X6N4U1_NEPPI|nr:hypothetical protein NPIL_702231 [Nephila pilipes]